MYNINGIQGHLFVNNTNNIPAKSETPQNIDNGENLKHLIDDIDDLDIYQIEEFSTNSSGTLSNGTSWGECKNDLDRAIYYFDRSLGSETGEGSPFDAIIGLFYLIKSKIKG